jgi:hypothetical protein
LVAIIEPSLAERDLFDDASERREQAQRLRLDLFAFRDICQAAAETLDQAALPGTDRALEAMKAYVGYFRDVSYQLLRYGDYEAFDRFAAIVAETDAWPMGPLQRHRLAGDCRLFVSVLDRTFAAVGRRGDLAQVPFDAEEGRRLARRFTC